MFRQEVAGAAEPGQENRESREVDEGQVAATPHCRVRSARGAGQGRMAVRQMDMEMRQMQGAADERQCAQGSAYDQAYEIERRPCHSFAPTGFFLPAPPCDASAGFKTSVKRSTSSGASRIAPRRIRHLRVSRCLATCSRA